MARSATRGSWYWQNKRYFDRTWVNGQYRISQGNYYDYHGPRTNNNHVEGWHLWLKKKQLENLIPVFLRSSIWCERSKLPRRWNSTSLKPALCNFLEKEMCAERCKIKHIVWEISEWGCNLADYLSAVRHQSGLETIITGEFVCAFFNIINSVAFVKNYIELLCWPHGEVDLMGVDLVGVDLVGGHRGNGAFVS